MKNHSNKAQKTPYTLRIAGPMGTLTIQEEEPGRIKVEVSYVDAKMLGPTAVNTTDIYFQTASNRKILEKVSVSHQSFVNAVNAVRLAS